MELALIGRGVRQVLTAMLEVVEVDAELVALAIICTYILECVTYMTGSRSSERCVPRELSVQVKINTLDIQLPTLGIAQIC